MLLGFALDLPSIRTARDTLPSVVICAGVVYAYSFPGLFWLAGTVGVYWAIARPWETVKPFLLGHLFALVLIAPEIGRLIDFSHFKAFSPSTANSGGLGNLRHQLSPAEAFGIWLTSEFRLAASDAGHPIASTPARCWDRRLRLRRSPLGLPLRLEPSRGAGLRCADLRGRPHLGHRLHVREGAGHRLAAGRAGGAGRLGQPEPARTLLAPLARARRSHRRHRARLELPRPPAGPDRAHHPRRRARDLQADHRRSQGPLPRPRRLHRVRAEPGEAVRRRPQLLRQLLRQAEPRAEERLRQVRLRSCTWRTSPASPT